MKTLLRRCAVLALLTFAGVTVGCNTIEGAGEDISELGEGVSDTSRDARD